MLPEILKSKRFVPLLFTQFLGAVNDNLFKNMLLTFVVVHFAEKSDVLSNVIAALFIIPFFLFSAMAGEVADKYNRDLVARRLKIIELCLMVFVGIVYFINNLYLFIYFQNNT